MASMNKFNCFGEDLGLGVHDLSASGDTIKIYLTNIAPSASGDAVLADLVGITEENGYAEADLQNDWSESGGTSTLTAVDVTWTASGGSFGPFRYSVAYNSTTTVKTNPLIGWWDYGSSITVSDGEAFLADIGASLWTLT